ncbi:hypothetical protein, partial [Acidithiobacillus caldus]|uniref:hypothetical protein n=1 Tax=Acidithiobacillus caldus TaxID=33059 RepID=UPI001C065A01
MPAHFNTIVQDVQSGYWKYRAKLTVPKLTMTLGAGRWTSGHNLDTEFVYGRVREWLGVYIKVKYYNQISSGVLIHKGALLDLKSLGLCRAG